MLRPYSIRAISKLSVLLLASGILYGLFSMSLFAQAQQAEVVTSGLDATNTGPIRLLKLREQKIKDAVRKVTPATVCVTDNIGFGSGVVVSADGLVLTAGHVLVTDGKRLRLIFPDGREVRAKRLGMDLSADAGMAQIIEPGPWPYVEMAKAGSVERGDWCIALGHSGGYVLGRRPPVRTGRVLNTNKRRIVTDCALIGGDSGGPLFNLSGELIGIHSSIGTSIAENRHVAMDVFEANWKRLLDGESWGELAQLSKARPNGPILGIKLNKERDNQAQILRVAKDSPAAAAGLEAGDFITEIDGEVIIDWQHVIDTIADRKPGDRIRLKIYRDGKPMEVQATLKKRGK